MAEYKNIIVLEKDGEIEVWSSFKKAALAHNDISYSYLKQIKLPLLYKGYQIYKVPLNVLHLGQKHDHLFLRNSPSAQKTPTLDWIGKNNLPKKVEFTLKKGLKNYEEGDIRFKEFESIELITKEGFRRVKRVGIETWLDFEYLRGY